MAAALQRPRSGPAAAAEHFEERILKSKKNALN
jgi:hypothetical protein